MNSTFSIDTLAARWDVHPNTVRRQMRTGKLPRPLKIGLQYRWPAQVIHDFEQRQLEGAKDAK